MADTDRELRLGRLDVTAATRTAICVVIGVALAVGCLALPAMRDYAAAIGWVGGAGLFVALAWALLLRLTPEQTKWHAEREDATRATVDILVNLSALASLVAVVHYLARAASLPTEQQWVSIGAGLATIIVSWTLVHTVFAMRYARLYFGWRDEAGDQLPDTDGNDGGIDFNQQGLPDYRDFAYLAFTIGMTYQVSDQAIQRRTIRREVTKHALISFVFGATIIASAVNLIASLT